MRIVRGHRNFIYKRSAQTLDRAPGCKIIGVACDRGRPQDRPDQGRHGSTRLQRVTVPPKPLCDLKSDMTGANTNVLRISHPQIDEADIRPTRRQDAEMVIRNEAARRIAGHNVDESQDDLAKGEAFSRRRQHIVCERCGHRELIYFGAITSCRPSRFVSFTELFAPSARI